MHYFIVASCQRRTESLLSTSPDQADPKREQSNLLVLVMHQVMFRAAWIFKTESVIMPAFLDSLTESGWVRGLLPPLNRFGQSLAPLLMSERLSKSSLKKRWLVRTTLLMSLPFLTIGSLKVVYPDSSPIWFPVVFLISYGVFFCLHGVNQSSYNTIQGKLIRPDRRGRLVMLAGWIGSPLAVGLALFLLGPWTQAEPTKFGFIFLFTGSAFLLASFAARRLQETPDEKQPMPALNLSKRLIAVRKVLTSDPHLRHLCLMATLFVTSQMLFPHYQALGRQAEGFEGQMLMTWVVGQNLAAAAFSWFSGVIADRYGTRLALRCLLPLASSVPLLSLLLAQQSADYFTLTFIILGVVPVTFRMQLNYVLELTARENHPIYVSTVVVCMAAPMLFSPFLGGLIDSWGYVIPFAMVTGCVSIAWLMSLWMVEPRDMPDLQG